MSAHLLILLVVIPLFSAPLCILLRRSRLVWLLSSLSTGACLLISILLLQQVYRSGTVTYMLGGWSTPLGIGIEYRLDLFAALVALFVSLVGFAVALYSYTSLQKELPRHKHPLFAAAYLLCLAGLLGITVTADVFNLFVFLEISSLSSYALISMGRDRAALLASFRYLIMGTIGATFLLIGIGLIYSHTGTLNMSALQKVLPALTGKASIQASLAFIMLGLAIKSALFPLHLWLPSAYTHAPSAVSAFLAGTATKVSIYALARFIYSVFGKPFVITQEHIGIALITLSIPAMLLGSMLAIKQQNLKRMLAYSSIAQIGYLFLGLGLSTVASVGATITHLFNHALIKSALFLSLGCIVYRTGKAEISSLSGLARQMPWTMAAFTVAGLGLIGIPLTAGFISKWALIRATLTPDYWPLAVVILITSLLAVVYIWRVIEAAYFQPPAPGSTGRTAEAPLGLLVPTWLLVLLSLYFGIQTTVNFGIAVKAATALVGG